MVTDDPNSHVTRGVRGVSVFADNFPSSGPAFQPCYNFARKCLKTDFVSYFNFG